MTADANQKSPLHQAHEEIFKLKLELEVLEQKCVVSRNTIASIVDNNTTLQAQNDLWVKRYQQLNDQYQQILANLQAQGQKKTDAPVEPPKEQEPTKQEGEKLPDAKEKEQDVNPENQNIVIPETQNFLNKPVESEPNRATSVSL